MTAPKIGERHRECAKEVVDDIYEHLRNPLWEDHSEEIIARHFPEDDLATAEVTDCPDWVNECVDKIVDQWFFTEFPEEDKKLIRDIINGCRRG